MNKSCMLLAAMAAALAVSAARAEEKFDPAARAKVVAPFVEPQTVAVMHVDLSRVAVNPLFDALARLSPQATAEMQDAKSKLGGALDGLGKIGVRDFYLVLSMSPLPPRPPLGLLVLKPGVDAESVLAAVPGFKVAAKRVGDVLVVADSQKTLAALGSLVPDDRPELAKAFATAGDTAVQLLLLPPKHFARVVEDTLPELPKQIGGGPSTIVTRGMLWAAAGIDLPPHASARLIIQSQDAAAAQTLVQKLGDAFRFLARLPETKSLLPDFDQISPRPMAKSEGDQVVLALDETWIRGALQLLDRARLAARRSQSLNNLKQIGLAMHNYHAAEKSFPPAAMCDNRGKPLLSWRVLILPYVDQMPLYRDFHLDESWDSPHNKTLIARMPPIYRSPLSKLADRTRTNYVLPVGPDAAFNGPRCIAIKDVRDGTSNTIMTLEADDSQAVIWTRPDDLPFDPKAPLQGLGHLLEGGFQAGFMDGSVRFLSNTIAPARIKAMITPAGGETVD